MQLAPTTGILHAARMFINQSYCQQHPDHFPFVNFLADTIRDQIFVFGEAFRMNGRFVPSNLRTIHNQAVQSDHDMVKELGPQFGVVTS
jgi:hypothetical protein